MPKTLLAVDDSATMRKVLEITFAGEDFRVITADGGQSALARLSEDPRVIVIDTVLAGEDGYGLCKEVRKRAPGAAIVLLSSRHNPYDAARGRDAGADDYMDKPFDTQQMIDKVRKAMLSREGGVPVAAASAPAVPPAAPSPGIHRPPPGLTPPTPAAAAKQAPGRGHTLMFGDPPPAGAAAARPPTPEPAPVHRAPPPPAAPPPAAARPVAHVPPPAAPPVHAEPSVAGRVNGQLAGKLAELGLTPQQADAVLALSKDVVERVVWEVVPQLAEALIKEEIARLMKE